MEPLLGPVPGLDLRGIDWVIVGGESGPGARPMREEWVANVQAQAEAAWKALSGRFSSLASLSKIVVPYKTENSSGYRLRAGAPSPADAQRTCQLLRVAGENCFVVR